MCIKSAITERLLCDGKGSFAPYRPNKAQVTFPEFDLMPDILKEVDLPEPPQPAHCAVNSASVFLVIKHTLLGDLQTGAILRPHHATTIR